MDRSRYLECLATDQTRLRQVAAADLAAAVPTCPGWSVADLVRHVSEVYLHKVECMRQGVAPESWPPGLSGEAPLPLLDRSYQALLGEFDARATSSPAATWHDPDQTVGFWIRRMAQETVIHRVDAELAAGEPVAEIAPDLAVDGIDEVLRVFLAYATQRWPEEFGGVLPATAERVLVTTGQESWLIRLEPSGAVVEDGFSRGGGRVGPGGAPADATVSAAPPDLLLWLWRRSGADAAERRGDQSVVDRFRQVLGAVTQ
jgi:uncharacterized protein (TIGR03083 family)